MTFERSIFSGAMVLGLAMVISAPARAQGDATSAPTSGVPATPAGASTDVAPGVDSPASADAGATSPRESAAPADDESGATSQVASFAATQLKDSPAVVTVISGDDIRTTGARDLIDILYMVPGFFFGVDTEGVVGPGFRGLWGHEGKILLIIDGKEINDLLFSNMQLGNEFPVELIERVEIVRGPGSVIYGGSAELAVINVITRGLQGSTDLKASASYGQMPGANKLSDGFGRRRVTGSGRWVVDELPGLSAFASVSLGEGQRSVRDYVDNTGASATMEGQSALNSSIVQAGVGYRNVQASALYSHLATTSIDGAGSTLATPLPVYFDAFHGELVGTFHPNEQIEIVPRFNFTYQKPWTAPNMDEYFYDKSVRRLRGRLLGRWAALEHLQLTVGGDAIFDEAKLLGPVTGVQTQFGNANSVDHQTYATYAEVYSDNPIVNVSAGARYDHQSTIGGSLVPRLVLLRKLGPVSLKGLFSLSFRAPSIENINDGINVRPEHARVIEFEGALDLTAEQRLSANVFDESISSPIAYTHDQATNADGYVNLGRQGTRGFEIAYRWRRRTARIEANYSFYAPSVSDNISPYTLAGHGDQFLGAPAHRISAFGTVRTPEWLGLSISPTLILLGPRYMRGAPDAGGNETSVGIPTQLLANLFVSRDNVWVRGLTVGLGVYNLFGANYSFVHASAAPAYADDHAPLPGLDREVLLRATYLVE